MTTTTTKAPSAMPWWLLLIQGISAIILGFFLLTTPGQTTLILVQFLGIYWLVRGIFDIVMLFVDRTAWGWKLFTGILGIIAGILIIQHPLWATVLVPASLVLVIGILGVVIGITNLIQAFRGGGWGMGILGVISVLLGLVLIGNPVVGALALPWVLGIIGIGGGIVAIIYSFRLR